MGCDDGAGSSASLDWNVSATEQAGPKASDAVKLTQKIAAAIPVSSQQATIAQVDGTLTLSVAPSADASRLSDGKLRGGIAVSLQPKLDDGLPGVRRWFERYPYNCLEQQTSRALGLMDAAQWQGMLTRMPSYRSRRPRELLPAV